MQQALEQSAGDDLADLLVGHPAAREEGLVHLVAELAIEALGVGNLRDFGIDQALRQMEAELVGERDQGALVDQAVEQRREITSNRGIFGSGLLLADLLEPALHRLGHLALGDFLVAGLDQSIAAHAEAHVAGPEILDIAHGEAGQDPDQNNDHCGGADFRLGHAAEK